jgi:hypothetical protein
VGTQNVVPAVNLGSVTAVNPVKQEESANATHATAVPAARTPRKPPLVVVAEITTPSKPPLVVAAEITTPTRVALAASLVSVSAANPAKQEELAPATLASAVSAAQATMPAALAASLENAIAANPVKLEELALATLVTVVHVARIPNQLPPTPVVAVEVTNSLVEGCRGISSS